MPFKGRQGIGHDAPHRFVQCPGCGKKGVYRHRGTSYVAEGKIVPIPDYYRCRYCGDSVAISQEAKDELGYGWTT